MQRFCKFFLQFRTCRYVKSPFVFAICYDVVVFFRDHRVISYFYHTQADSYFILKVIEIQG